MRRAIVLVGTALALLTILSSGATAAIKITQINFDPAGDDAATNASRNREYVVIENTGDAGQRIGGWMLSDSSGRTHKFKDGVKLVPGNTIRLHSGRGRNESACAAECIRDLFWGLSIHIWNNDGDVATLENRRGDIVDRCAYSANAESPTSCAAEEPAPQGAAGTTTYQGDATHAGHIDDPVLNGPLGARWSANLGGPMSYPVVGRDRAFVTVRPGPDSSGGGTTVKAVSLERGEVAWERPIGGSTRWSALAYADGIVFALNYDGTLLALNASDGTSAWVESLPGQYAFSSAPVVKDGVVYTGGAGSGGTEYAVNAENGDLLWTQPVANGDQSSPALSETKLFVSYSCPNVYAFDRISGASAWTYSGGCSGGGGRTPAYHEGRVYVRDSGSGYVFDATDGALVDSFESDTIPAFRGDMGFYTNDGDLIAIPSGGSSRWVFSPPEPLTSAPLVVNGTVYIGAEAGTVYGLNATSGEITWTDTVGQPIPKPDEHNVSQPLTGFGAGQGLLLVPSETKLTAFGPNA